MERELEKDLKEIEYLIYAHKERENTHTQSVLERAHEIIDRKSTRLNSSHKRSSRMPSSA